MAPLQLRIHKRAGDKKPEFLENLVWNAIVEGRGLRLGDGKCLYLDQSLDHVQWLSLLILLPVLNFQILLSNFWLFSNISK